MTPTGQLLLYCLLIAVASLLGGWTPLRLRLTHRQLQLALSLVSGVILGIGVLEMLPHAIHLRAEASGGDHEALLGGGLDAVLLWLLAGFLAMFLIERFFCFHHHEGPAPEDAAGEGPHDHAAAPTTHAHEHELTWAGALVGLTLHSLVAGGALAAGTLADPHGHATNWLGVGTFLIVFLHKPFDSLTLGALMAVRGQPRRQRQVVNGLFALTVPAGAGLFALGLGAGGPGQALVLSGALAAGAGAFLCIALSDLLPELQFHQHDRLKLSLALVLGLAIAWGVSRLEAAGHDHGEVEVLASPGPEAPRGGLNP